MSMDLLGEIEALVESKSRDSSTVFKIKVGEKKTIRFLCEFNAGLAYDYHGRYYPEKERQQLGYRVPCPTSFKKYAERKGIKVQDYGKNNCPYCQFKDEKGTTSTQQQFVWLIWNYTDGCMQAFTYKVTSNTPIYELASQYKLISKTKTKRTIMDRDFFIECEEKNGFANTKLNKDDQSDFVITSDMKSKGCFLPQNDAEAQRKMLDLMAKAWCPELLNPSPEFELPDRLKPKNEVNTLDEVNDIFSDEDMLDKLPGMDGYDQDASLEDDLSRL